MDLADRELLVAQSFQRRPASSWWPRRTQHAAGADGSIKVGDIAIHLPDAIEAGDRPFDARKAP